MCPIYTYQCDHCKTTIDLIRNYKDADTLELCGNCGKPTHRVFNPANTSFELKGPGWFKTDGKY